MILKHSLPTLCLLATSLSTGLAIAQTGADVHLNQLQVIGTHNSYHAGLTPAEAKLLADKNPRIARALDYHHAPLSNQLDSGVRQVELDVFYDPQGGLYGHPANLSMIAATGATDTPYDPAHQMDKPGFKVMHVQDLDSAVPARCSRTASGRYAAGRRRTPITSLFSSCSRPSRTGSSRCRS